MAFDRELGLGTPVSWRAAHKKCMVKQLVYKEFIHAESVKQGVSNLFVQRMGGTVYFVVGMENGSIMSFCANAGGLGLGGGIERFNERDFWKSEMEQKVQCDGEVKEGRLIKSDASVRNWEIGLQGMVTGTVGIENSESNLELLYGFPPLVFLSSYSRVITNRSERQKRVLSLQRLRPPTRGQDGRLLPTRPPPRGHPPVHREDPCLRPKANPVNGLLPRQADHLLRPGKRRRIRTS